MSFDFVDKKLGEIVSEGEELTPEIEDQMEYIFGEDEDSGEAVLNEGEDNLEEDYEADDNDILEAMDTYLIASMKEQMRLEVLANEDMSDSDKVKAVQRISEITFQEEDVIDFANQYIAPVMEICESFANDSEKDPLVIPLPLYEICAILEDAKLGRITDIYMAEADEESMVTDVEAETDQTDQDDKEAGEAGDSCECDTKDEVNSVISSEMAMELINLSLDENNILDKSDRDSAINEAINLLALFGFDALRPNIIEVIENIYLHDRKAEGKGGKRFFEIMEDIKTGEDFPVENFGKLEENSTKEVDYLIREETEVRINGYIGGRYEIVQESDPFDAHVRATLNTDAWKNFKDIPKHAVGRLFRGFQNHYTDFKTHHPQFNTKLAKGSIVGGSVLAAAAILAVSLAAYRHKKYGICQVVKNRYDQVKCLITACDDAIRSVKAQKRGCDEFATSPAKCKLRCDKLVLKWEKKKQKYMKKLISIKAREQKISDKHNK